MIETFLVETPDGAQCYKSVEELRPDDRHIVDGPESFSTLLAAQADLEAEIAAAGGIAAWREAARP